MILPNNIRYLRRSRGWSQEHLAELLGYKSYTTIQKWETGVSEPPLKKAHALADVFAVDIDELTKVDLEHQQPSKQLSSIPPGFQPMPEMAQVPIIGRIACGEPITAEENVEGIGSIPAVWRADFILLCKGRSMEPKILNGDAVAIRAQPEVENGQIAAVRIGDEATLKRVYRYPERLELRPINPDFETMFLWREEMNSASIEGLAVGLCREI